MSRNTGPTFGISAKEAASNLAIALRAFPSSPSGEAEYWNAVSAANGEPSFSDPSDLGYQGNPSEFAEWDKAFMSKHRRDVDALRQLQSCWPYCLHPQPVEERTIWVDDEHGDLLKVSLG